MVPSKRSISDICMTKKLRLAVTGKNGQVVSALIARAPDYVKIIPLSRPQFDLQSKTSVIDSLRNTTCDVIVNAAGYTAVDNAECEVETAMRINGDGAGFVAEAAAALNVPLLHLSTDYVFNGELDRPYREDDQTSPTSAYGRSKLEGEKRIANVHPNHVILRTAWIYSTSGSNFVKTMLRLGETMDEVGVVSDQVGNPTYAFDIADALFLISRRLITDKASDLRGVFHMVGQGDASWAEFATMIFETAYRNGRSKTKVKPITTSDYPTSAKRPANSRLDTSKLKSLYDVSLPDWHASVEDCVQQLLKN